MLRFLLFEQFFFLLQNDESPIRGFVFVSRITPFNNKGVNAIRSKPLAADRVKIILDTLLKIFNGRIKKILWWMVLGKESGKAKVSFDLLPKHRCLTGVRGYFI